MEFNYREVKEMGLIIPNPPPPPPFPHRPPSIAYPVPGVLPGGGGGGGDKFYGGGTGQDKGGGGGVWGFLLNINGG